MCGERCCPPHPGWHDGLRAGDAGSRQGWRQAAVCPACHIPASTTWIATLRHISCNTYMQHIYHIYWYAIACIDASPTGTACTPCIRVAKPASMPILHSSQSPPSRTGRLDPCATPPPHPRLRLRLDEVHDLVVVDFQELAADPERGRGAPLLDAAENVPACTSRAPDPLAAWAVRGAGVHAWVQGGPAWLPRRAYAARAAPGDVDRRHIAWVFMCTERVVP